MTYDYVYTIPKPNAKSYGNEYIRPEPKVYSVRSLVPQKRTTEVDWEIISTADNELKVSAFLELIQANPRTKEIMKKAKVHSHELLNMVDDAFYWTFGTPHHTSMERLRKFIKDEMVDHISDNTVDFCLNSDRKRDLRVEGMLNRHKVVGMANPYVTCTRSAYSNDKVYATDNILSYYIVTIFTKFNLVEFVAHKWTPLVGSRLWGGSETLTPVDTAVFLKDNTGGGPHSTDGVFAFYSEQKIAHECVLDDAFVSEEGHVQVYVFHWIRTSSSDADWDNVKNADHDERRPLLVLSKEKVR
eukprot:Lankesteria_metandrocarpae@DN5391_c0_g1_i3.p1